MVNKIGLYLVYVWLLGSIVGPDYYPLLVVCSMRRIRMHTFLVLFGCECHGMVYTTSSCTGGTIPCVLVIMQHTYYFVPVCFLPSSRLFAYYTAAVLIVLWYSST